jgi:pimeloyl-ACP methyl ester carboxylesterase
MPSTLLFIHGLYATPRTWDRWVPFFEQRGYPCLAPAWPLHDVDPKQARDVPPAGLGGLGLEDVVDHYAGVAAAEGERPVVVGHSMGGLVAQILLSRGLASAAICISSVAPNRMLAFDWSFLLHGASIVNPLKGDEPHLPTPEQFHEWIANTLTPAEAQAAYAEHIIPDSRKVVRDILGRIGQIDLDQPHGPILFIAGEQDRLIPHKLNVKNAEAYTDPGSVSDFQDFADRSHFICNEPGWQAVASFVEGWLAARVGGEVNLGYTLR